MPFEGFIEWAQRERTLGNEVCFGIVPPGLTAAVGIIQLRAQELSWFSAEWGFAIGASRQRTLIRERFSITEARASIAAAILDTERRLHASRPRPESPALTPRLHPFFVSE